MDSIKDQLNTELQKITFSIERKQEIIHNVKSSREHKTRGRIWKYRIVLTSFILLSVAFMFINSKAGNSSSATQADGGGTLNFLGILTYDSVKTLLLAILFFIIYGLLKQSIRKQGSALPFCANCGSPWARKLAFKRHLEMKKPNVRIVVRKIIKQGILGRKRAYFNFSFH